MTDCSVSCTGLYADVQFTEDRILTQTTSEAVQVLRSETQVLAVLGEQIFFFNKLDNHKQTVLNTLTILAIDGYIREKGIKNRVSLIAKKDLGEKTSIFNTFCLIPSVFSQIMEMARRRVRRWCSFWRNTTSTEGAMQTTTTLTLMSQAYVSKL